MCGIYGLISLHREQIDDQSIARMGESLFHRGPDEGGGYADGPVVLGHRRLSIIDLATGTQPIFNEDQSIAIVFNGEIYNFNELRAKLIAAGHIFKTNSDTEAIVHLYEQYGAQCLQYLEGMFAFAIWDSHRKSLFLARDRYGIKPLIYYSDESKFVFASEINSLLSLKNLPKVLNFNSLSYYLTFNYIPAPFTIYRDIMKLEPGCFITVNLTGNKLLFRKSRYYDLAATTHSAQITDIGEAKRQLRDSLESSVQSHMISDVPLGAFLSGGIDSSIIVGLMARASRQSVKTFSIGYKGYGLFDETDFARQVAQFNNTDHYEFKLSYQEILNVIPTVLDNLGEPFSDWSIFPTYIVSRETRRHVKVALSGDGADELFGGYRKYLGEYFVRTYMFLPKVLREDFIEVILNLMPDSFNSSFLEYIRRMKRFVSGISELPEERHFKWMQIYTEETKKMLVKDYQRLATCHPHAFIYSFFQKYEGDFVNKMLYADLMFVLPDDMLVKVDHMSMLNSLEVRVPYLDQKVVELAFSMRGKLKLKGLKRKYVLVETFKDILPSRLYHRYKQGFDVPIGEWFKNELKQLFLMVVDEQSINKAGIFNYDFIKNMFDIHCANKTDLTKQLLNIFIFQWWFKKNIPDLI